MAENGQIIVIKKKKKGGHGGHHGGAWKVAYADFVTAMMAFFLLLWLLSAANKAQLQGISDYFKNPSGPPAAGGASTSVIVLGNNVDSGKGEGEKNRQSERPDVDEIYTEAFKREEIKQMEEMKAAIQESIESSPVLKELKDQIQLQITPEGLRIQILDKENRPMFDLGSAILKTYAQKLLRQIAPLLDAMPNRLSIAGHTDVLGYIGSNDYSNWELSVDRANAARRELLVGKMKEAKIARVVGHGSAVPFDAKNLANPANRRISIVLLKKQVDEAMRKDEAMDSTAPPGFIALPPIPAELSNSVPVARPVPAPVAVPPVVDAVKPGEPQKKAETPVPVAIPASPPVAAPVSVAVPASAPVPTAPAPHEVAIPTAKQAPNGGAIVRFR